jgi:chitodextrinase
MPDVMSRLHHPNEGSSRRPRGPTGPETVFRSRRQQVTAAVFWVVLLAAAALGISKIPSATAASQTAVFSDGFESGNLSQWTASSGMSVQQQVTYAGSWAARATTTGTPAYAYKTLSAPQSELYYDGRFQAISQRGTNVSIVRFRTAATGLIFSIMRHGSNGKLLFYNEVTGITAMGPVITTGSWHELEVHARVNGTSSVAEVWLDGVKVIGKTAESLGTTPVGRIYIGDSATGRTFDYAFDDQLVSATDTQPPSTPTGLTTTGNSLTSISLAWNASSDNVGVAGYDLLLNGTRIGTTTGTSYTFPALACGTGYTLGVDAYDGSGNTSSQTSVTASTASCGGPAPPDAFPPTNPAGLRITNTTQSTVALSWNASTDNVGVAGYDAFRDGSKVGTTSATTYTFTGLNCGTTYTFGIDAFDAAGNASGRANITTGSSPCGGDAFYVSPTGSDSNPGTLTQPWRTIGKAMASLQAGQTAYLRAGTFEENTSGSCGASFNKLIWTRSGTSTSPITISGYPGEQKQVIVKTAIRLAGSYQVFANVVAERNRTYETFDSACTGGPNVQLYGDHDTVSGVEVRNSNASGVYAEGAASATLSGNWIHDNGSHWNLDHGVYWLSGPNSTIANNIVEHNYANGIKVGPNAQSLLVSENTVNGNGRSGITVCGDTSYTSNNNTVADNILTWNGWSSGGGFGLRTYWESAGIGTGNQAVRNLMYGNTNDNTWYPGGGMTENASILLDPRYVNSGAGDFRLQTGSPAVDTANSGYSTTRDYAGAPRPQGAGPDLGAYER